MRLPCFSVCKPAVIALSLLLAGCQGSEGKIKLPKTVPASGTVTLDGKPLEGAAVMFFSTGNSAGSDSMGSTDSAGKYSLSLVHGGSGAPPGNYKVIVSHMAGPGGKPIQRGIGAPPPIDQGAVESLPARYSNMNETSLNAVIPEGGGEFNFELKSKKK